MTKILFWLVLIVGIVVLIGSCKKDEESTTATPTSCGGDSTKTIASSCSGTASGSITGIDNASL